VAEGMLVLQILNEEFIRGGTGTVRFSLENTGEEEIEVTIPPAKPGACKCEPLKAVDLMAT